MATAFCLFLPLRVHAHVLKTSLMFVRPLTCLCSPLLHSVSQVTPTEPYEERKAGLSIYINEAREDISHM